jgi:hypothetical protein
MSARLADDPAFQWLAAQTRIVVILLHMIPPRIRPSAND